jgi:hypothetical protein
MNRAREPCLKGCKRSSARVLSRAERGAWANSCGLFRVAFDQEATVIGLRFYASTGIPLCQVPPQDWACFNSGRATFPKAATAAVADSFREGLLRWLAVGKPNYVILHKLIVR